MHTDGYALIVSEAELRAAAARANRACAQVSPEQLSACAAREVAAAVCPCVANAADIVEALVQNLVTAASPAFRSAVTAPLACARTAD